MSLSFWRITFEQPHIGMFVRFEFSLVGCDHVVWCTGICWLLTTLMIEAVHCSEMLPSCHTHCIQFQEINPPVMLGFKFWLLPSSKFDVHSHVLCASTEGFFIHYDDELSLQGVLLLKEVSVQKLLTQATLLEKICCRWLSKWHQN